MALPLLLTGLCVARKTNGNHVVAPIAPDMTPTTASRHSGSSAVRNPDLRQREPASSSAISTTVNAMKAFSSRYQVEVKPRNNPAPITAAQPPARSPARNPDHVNTNTGGNHTVIIAAQGSGEL